MVRAFDIDLPIILITHSGEDDIGLRTTLTFLMNATGWL
jgi:hypothetical protein